MQLKGIKLGNWLSFLIIRDQLLSNGFVAKHKVRLDANEFLQRKGLDFLEVFALVARLETVRLVIALANFKEWKLFQLDVK